MNTWKVAKKNRLIKVIFPILRLNANIKIVFELPILQEYLLVIMAILRKKYI